MKNNLRKGRHSVTVLYTHLVFVTKYRAKLFEQEGLETLEIAFKSVASKMDFKMVEFNGESDHVHLLVEYPPKLSISTLVNHLKGVSSRMYRQQFPSNRKHLWSPSYFASSCGGAPIETLKQYIQNQKSP
ncbi:MAG: IS200/IS605 family transposase [Symploca sp. SIO3E6]|nr:IS200/IS605 family transposase [Caldora sp. SIO3E6]